MRIVDGFVRAGLALLVGGGALPSGATEAGRPDGPPGPPPVRWSAGVAAVFVESPYVGQRGRLWGFPAVTYIGPRFRVVGPAAGVRLLQRGPVGFGLDARMRFSPFNEKEGGQLRGMRSRRSTVEAGPRVFVFLPFRVHAVLSLSADVLDEHGGAETAVEFSRSWRHGNWTLRPAARLSYWSAGLADHYYGVRGPDVAAERPAYRPGAVWMPALDLAISRRLGAGWSAMLSVGMTRMGSAVIASPIVDRRWSTRVMGAITHAF